MKRGVFLFLLVATLLAIVPLVSAGDDIVPRSHPPDCVNMPTFNRNVILHIHCEDIGHDIAHAFFIEHTIPLVSNIRYNRDTADILVYRPPAPYDVYLTWCVDDKAGSMTIGSFSWSPTGPGPIEASEEADSLATAPRR